MDSIHYMFNPPSSLQLLYNKVHGIVNYVDMLQESSHNKVAVYRSGDTENYCTFLSRLLVCIQKGGKSLSTTVSFVQFSSQSEIVARVIKRICEKKERNVLAFGYGLVDENRLSHVKFAPNICVFFPNTTTETVSNSILWETLLSRIGDDVMMHLLENCSLFMLVPPSCCYQISGQPIYNITNDHHCCPAWVKQRHDTISENVLFNYVQKKISPFKNCSLKKRKLSNKTTNKARQMHVKHMEKHKDIEGCQYWSSHTLQRSKKNLLEMTAPFRILKRQSMDIYNISKKCRRLMHDSESKTLSFVDMDLKSKGLIENCHPFLTPDHYFDSYTKCLLTSTYGSHQK
ncbi:uncharacterized protein LOC134609423 [Pelobates fuscus]|uniref:uncharacterized protein LOC134609423 n=1 Tax=Pelobates fuscus TaxID=191477 RepID=UPI002FE4DB85